MLTPEWGVYAPYIHKALRHALTQCAPHVQMCVHVRTHRLKSVTCSSPAPHMGPWVCTLAHTRRTGACVIVVPVRSLSALGGREGTSWASQCRAGVSTPSPGACASASLAGRGCRGWAQGVGNETLPSTSPVPMTRSHSAGSHPPFLLYSCSVWRTGEMGCPPVSLPTLSGGCCRHPLGTLLPASPAAS